MSKYKVIYQYTKQLIILCEVFLLFLLIHTHTFAQTVPYQSLRVSPVINDLQLTSGKPTSFTLSITNLSSNPLGIQTSISGFDETGGENAFLVKPSKMIYWTKISKNEVLINAHAQKNITVTIQTPSGIGPSGYYETIFLTPIINQELSNNTPIVLSRVGVLVLGTIGTLNYNDLAKKVTITNVIPANTILNNPPTDFYFTINNNYFTHFDAIPHLYITPLFGKTSTYTIEDQHVLPADFKTWIVPISHMQSSIFYTVHLSVSIGDGKIISQNSWFIVLPYKFLGVLILILLIVFFLIFKRENVKKALKVIISP